MHFFALLRLRSIWDRGRRGVKSLKMRQMSGVTLDILPKRPRASPLRGRADARARWTEAGAVSVNAIIDQGGGDPRPGIWPGVFGLRPRGCARGLQGEVTPGLRREWTVWETWGSLTFDRCVNGPKCPGCVRGAAPAYGGAQERGSEAPECPRRRKALLGAKGGASQARMRLSDDF